MSKLHKWAPLWAEYPDYINFPDSGEVKKAIGGGVSADWITNTCAIRLSRALNYNGFAVPANFPGLLTIKGADGKRYALRVREMRGWLEHQLGKPEFDEKKKVGAAFDRSKLASMSGIICFDVAFPDATGHLDLWDGKSFSNEYKMSKDYWVNASRISLWKALP